MGIMAGIQKKIPSCYHAYFLSAPLSLSLSLARTLAEYLSTCLDYFFMMYCVAALFSVLT
jgi:hypothetical protein